MTRLMSHDCRAIFRVELWHWGDWVMLRRTYIAR